MSLVERSEIKASILENSMMSCQIWMNVQFENKNEKSLFFQIVTLENINCNNEVM